MKVNEIREMSADELNQKLASLKEELFNLRSSSLLASLRTRCVSKK
jgi:ribosomal protein L29